MKFLCCRKLCQNLLEHNLEVASKSLAKGVKYSVILDFFLKCIYQNVVDQLELSWAHRGMFSAPMDELCCTNLYYLFRDSSSHLFCMYLKYVYGYFLGFAATVSIKTLCSADNYL